MLCRLCLNVIYEESIISLFPTCGIERDTRLLKMITKYLFLEILRDDPISTSICKNCDEHLEEFHKFCLHVEQRQNSLKSEFLEVECDADLQVENVNDDGDDNNEAFLDIKHIPIDVTEGVNMELEEAIECKDIKVEEEEEIVDRLASDECSNSINDIPLLKRKTKPRKGTIKTQRKGMKVVKTEKILIQNEPENVGSLKTAEEKIIEDVMEDVETKIPNSKELETGETCPLRSVRLKKVSSSESKQDCKNARIKKNELTQKKSLTKLKSYTTEELKQHDEFIASHIRLKCEICEDPMETFAKLRNHFRAAHNCKAYVVCCDRKFSKRFALVDHIQVHLNPDFFKCMVCQKNFKSRKCLESHQENSHVKAEDLKFECLECGKRFPRQSTLKQHGLVHQTERNFACEICEKTFVTKYRLKLHIKNLHENVTPYVCDFCGRRFKFKPSFDQHVANHQGITEPPAQCHICGMWLKHKNGLRQHISKHNEKDIFCQFCGRQCPSKSALQSHVRYIHRKTQDLKCTFCEKTFKMRKNLEEHIAIHTDEKHHACEHCHREFRSRANMYAHIKRDHFEEWSLKKLARSRAPPNVLEDNPNALVAQVKKTEILSGSHPISVNSSLGDNMNTLIS